MALTLADGTIDGQLKKIRMSLDGGGNAVVTPDSFGVLTDWTATAEGDTIVLMWSVSAGAWILNDIIGGQLS